MALVCQSNVFIQPQAYFGVAHSHMPELKLESGTVSSQIDTWSKIEAHQSVTKIDAEHNQIHLSNDKKFTYKALVLAPGFDHSS